LRSSDALLRQASVYAVSQVGARAIPFLLLPLVTRFLTPSDYGIVTMFALIGSVLDPLVGVNLSGALTVKFFDREIALPSYVGTGLTVAACLAGGAAVIVAIAGPALEGVTQVPQQWLEIAVLMVLARTAINAYLSLLRVREQAVSYGLFVNAQTLTTVVLSIGLIVILGLTWVGRLAAEAVGALVFGLLAIRLLRRAGELTFTPQISYVRDLLAFGVPLIPHALGGILLVQADRILITNLLGVSQTGIYAVGYQLALVVQLFADAFNNAYAPWLFRQLANPEPDLPIRLVRQTYLQIALFGLLAIAVTVVMPFVGQAVLGQSFVESTAFIGWFALAFFFSAAYYMVTNYIFFAQKTKFLSIVTASVAIANVPVTYVLIRLNGAVGAAQALALSYAMFFALTWAVSYRVYPLPWLSALRAHPKQGRG